ncbi:MAG: peptidylprolyl isomerase [Acidobacteria bacterium]|nr:peptidylprolyl isomerase [Acidobacteriota bacterium]
MLARSLCFVSIALSLVQAQTPPAAPKPAAAKPTTTSAKPKAVTAAKPTAAAPAKPVLPARPPGKYAILTITHGTQPLGNITFQFFDKESPVTVQNFIDLAQGRKAWTDPKTNARVRRPLYTGLTFHRVIPDFMIQGGDPLGNGTGGTDAIVDEFHPSLRFDQPGRVAMANAGPGTGSSQFFITEKPTPWLDGRHTIFGQVLEGQDLVPKIARLPQGPGNNPNVPVKMSRVVIQIVPDPAAAKPAAVKKAAPVPKAAPAAPKPAVKKQ